MLSLKTLRAFFVSLPLFLLSARAAVVNATWNSATDVAVTAANYTATGNTVNFTLNHAPATGANLTVVNNTGLPFIQGTFGNLAQGQKIALICGGIGYNFVANYYGGTGNDLVLQWADNRVVAWGYNYPGRLGDGSTTSRSVPTSVKTTGVLAGKTVISVSAGDDHSLALCSDGTLVAWGDNGYGELGNNSTAPSTVPVPVDQTGVLAGKTVIGISAGGSFSLALCSDGTIAAWGSGASGQLGNNITASSYVPVLVSTTGFLSGKSVVKIVAGGSHGLAICSDGSVASWGDNTYGLLGNGNTNSSPVPVMVVNTGALSGKIVVSVSAADMRCLVVTADGKAYSWGASPLGNGGSTSSLVPVAVTTTGILSGKSIAMTSTYSHSIVLCSDGTVASWGSNFEGQLGTNTSVGSDLPIGLYASATLSGKLVTSISAGAGFSVAACADGTLASWGSNGYGQLGNNSTTTSYSAVPVSNNALVSGERFGTSEFALSAGMQHIVGLVVSPSWPKAETVAASSLSSASATLNATVNSKSNSTAVSFQYGLTPSYGSTVDLSQSPVTGNTDTAVSANISGLVAGTTYHYRVVATNALGTAQGADLTFVAASNNANLSSLTLGTGTLAPTFVSATTEYTTSVPNTSTSITLRPTLADTTAAVRVNGVVVASGVNSGAINLAVGINLISTVVTAQDGITTKTYNVTITRLSANADLASLTTGTGAISPAFDPATVGYTLAMPYEVTGMKVTPTVADNTATVKVNTLSVISGTASGTLNLAVGSNTITVLVTAQNATTKTYTLAVTRQALVTTYNAATDVPVTVNGLTATGNTANLSLNFTPVPGTNLTVVNNTGMNFISGAFTNLAHGQIIPLSLGGVTYQFVANYYGGNGNDLVLQWANTRPLAWGSNGNGQLGNNGVLDSAIPVPVVRTGVLAGKTLLSLASGGNHSLALAADGSVSAWGNNSYGQLGNGTTTDSLVPVNVTATGVLLGKTVIAIAAGQYHNVALCSDGTLAAWGYNFYGQLGNGSTTQSSVPVTVSKTGVLAGKTIISIAAGTYHSFALCSDGTLAAWGYNGNGELGNGGTGFSQLPVLVDSSGVLAGKTISSVVAGSFHSFALCTDGTLAGWGYNAYGQPGNNSVNPSTVPTLVNISGMLSGKTIVSASAGYYHTLALCSDGTLAAWGFNGDGELGNGDTTSSQVPVAVNLSGVLAGKTLAGISVGAIHNVALCSDGTVATWGYNGDGELGNNSATSSNVPVAISTSALVAGERFVVARSGATSLHNLALVASPPLPVVTTLGATSITPTSVVLNGTINPNGVSTTPKFDYGLTTAYGTSVTGIPSAVTGIGSTAVSLAISGLAPGTTYHYRLGGTSAGGTTLSADMIFTTAGYNANLSALTLSAGPLSPVFSSGVVNYAATAANTTTSTTLTPTLASPTSTVKVNGATVASGAASMPIFLAPGLNTITVVVTAQDGVTSKTYTLAVTRIQPSPEIQVFYAAANIADGGTRDFGFSSAGRSSNLSFTVKNTGNADLTGLGITLDGTDAAMFDVTSPAVAPVAGPSGSTTFAVRFLATSTGAKTAALHIVSNDADENPFDIILTGLGLSPTADTDGDGLNDAAEFQMEALGFDWQLAQPTLVDVYFANAAAAGLGGGHGLQVDAPMLNKDPSTGLFKLRIGIRKSTDLLNFTPFPMTAPQTGISADGKLEFEFVSPDNAAFYRLQAE